MKAYTRYSYFVERKLGLGRTGKRLAHGAAVGGGVFAAGHYGGVEIIQSNLIASVGAGVATGFLGTLALDAMLLDAEEEALMLQAEIEDADKEVTARLAVHFFGEAEPEPQAQSKSAARAAKA